MSHQSDLNRHFIVLRFEGMSPCDLAGYEVHRLRKGGDLGHVDHSRSNQNQRLIGEADWAQTALNILEARKAENFAEELASLKKRKRKKDMMRRIAEGPHDPWRGTRHGPLREVILTANKEWFDDLDLDFVDGKANLQAREDQFEERAVAWLEQNFGADVIHARADRDEAAYHIHAVIAPWTKVNIKGAERWMLQPSIHSLIKNYEEAQNSVGAWFSDIGLKRGERRKQAFRDAINQGLEPPEKRVHVRPAEWRRREDIRLAKEAEAVADKTTAVEKREAAADAKMAEGEAMIAGAEGIENGTLEPYDTVGGPRLRPTKPAAKDSASPTLLARLRKSEQGHRRVAAALAAALRRITQKAEVTAKANARKDLEQQFTDIEAANEAIITIAKIVPQGMRQRIADAHKKLAARIMGAGKSLRSVSDQTSAKINHNKPVIRKSNSDEK
ncbi:plasmid recombination protein [Roseobacter litoralis]|uniref:plasmid recombination protein n=1 Tax=Roseobacter litoralis TaxID=42443 RepID=UPI002494EBB7|nr:plasmid recombination protein [Roseobacter litoralis]